MTGLALRHLLVVTVSALLFGCAAPRPATTPEYARDAQPVLPAVEAACILVASHTKADGTHVPEAYSCSNALSANTLSAYGCTWVTGYSRSDGTFVQGHNRCGEGRAATTQSSPTNHVPAATSSSTASDAPCVTGYCGSTNVRGYHRKDGTYVRPHTRSRGRR